MSAVRVFDGRVDVVTGVIPVSAAFANPMIFLFMGGLIKCFAYWLLSRRWVDSNPRRIFLAIGLATDLCSNRVSNTGTAATMFPICLGLLDSIKEMMTAYSASIGMPPNLIMLGFLDSMQGSHISR